MFSTVTAQLGNLLPFGPFCQEARQREALRAAIRELDRSTVKQLLASRPTLAFETDDEGGTPLHWLMEASRHRTAPADRRDEQVILACLLDAHADPDQPDKAGRTPLHVAVQPGCDVSCLNTLLARGANVHASDAHGRTALHLAMAARASEAIVVALLDRGADAMRPDRQGQTAAALAAGRRWTDARLLAPVDQHSNARARAHAASGAANRAANRAPNRAANRISVVPPVPAVPVAGEPLFPGMPASDRPVSALERSLMQIGASYLRGHSAKGAALAASLREMTALLRETAPAGSRDVERQAPIRLALEILIAICPNVDQESLQPCHACFRAIRQVAPALDRTHPDLMIALYVELARLWTRTKHWKEAYCYAFHAYRLATSEGAGSVPAVETMLDRTEAAILRDDLTQWGPVAIVPIRRALFDMGTLCASGRHRLPALREADRLLRRALHARALLRDELDPAHSIPLFELRSAVQAQLSETRTASLRAGEFIETGELVLSLARSLGGLGLAAEGAALCALVVRQLEEEECVGELRHYEYARHRQLAVELREARPMPARQRANWRELRTGIHAARAGARNACKALVLLSPADEALADWQTPLPIERLQSALTAGLVAQLRGIVERCEWQMLCEPPCRYALIALGSMARGDMLPYSDVECVLLLEERAEPGSMVEQWFVRYTRLLELAFYSVGESSIGSDHPLAPPRGFELDTSIGSSVAWHEWCGTPEQMVAQLRRRAEGNRRDGLHTDQDIHFSLLSPALVHGEAGLMDRLSTAMRAELDAQVAPGPRHYSARQDIALRQLHADAGRLRWRADQQARSGDATIWLKAAYAAPLVHLLTGMAQCHGIRDAAVPAMLARLDETGQFSRAFLADWRWALSAVQTIRCRLEIAGAGRVDGVSRDNLSVEEQATLRAVRHRVLLPLWYALSRWVHHHGFPQQEGSGVEVIAVLRALDGCEPAFLPFAWTKASPQPRRAPNLGALHGLAATLAARSSDLAAVREHYGALLAATPSAYQPSCWAIWREHLAVSAHGRATLRVLGRIPDAAGWRGDWNETRDAFLARLRSWSQAPAGSDVTLQLPVPGAAGSAPVVLGQRIVAQLFDPDGYPHGYAENGASMPPDTVIRVSAREGEPAFDVRFQPANAVAELSAHALECRLAGTGGMPFGTLAYIRHGERTYVVHIAEAVDGPTVAQCIADTSGVLPQIEAVSFGRALLRALLVDPHDDDADHYALVPLAAGAPSLHRIGPERGLPGGLYWPTPGAGPGGSVLYCLDQMLAPLDSTILATLRQLEPETLIDAWLDDMRQMQRRHVALFGASTIAGAFEPESGQALLLPVIPSDAREILLSRLGSMHALAALADRYGVALTGMDLLMAVRPDLAGGYIDAFRCHPPTPARDIAGIVKRLTWMANQSGDAARVGGPVIQTVVPVGLAPPRRPVRRRDLDGVFIDVRRDDALDRAHDTAPAAAAIAWDDGTLSHSAAPTATLPNYGAIVTDMMQDQPGARRRFAALPDLQRAAIFGFTVDAMMRGPWRPNADQRSRLLKGIVGTPVAGLDLRPFAAVLDDHLLTSLLQGAGTRLRTLDLSGCVWLTAGCVGAIARHAPGLTDLALRDVRLGTLAAVEGLGASLLPPWRLPALRRLDLSGNADLRRVALDTPALISFAARDCGRLHDVVLRDAALRELDLRGCESLPETMLMRLAGAGGTLDRAQLGGCDEFRHIAFREQFPWLLDLPWDDWPESLIGILQALLRGSDAGTRPYPSMARDLVRESLKTRQMVRSALEGLRHRSNVSARTRDAAKDALVRIAAGHTDDQAAGAAMLLAGDDQGSVKFIADSLLASLMKETDERALGAAICAVTRLAAMPSPEQIARWLQLG